MFLLAASALGHMDEASLDAQWDQWKLTHSKEYNGLVSVCLCAQHFKLPIQFILPIQGHPKVLCMAQQSH